LNVLITSASRKVSLVQAFQRAVAAEGGGRVVAADCQARAAALHVADRARLLPRTDDPAFWNALVTLVHDEAIGLLVPTRDEELVVFAERSSELEAMGVWVPVASPESVRLCQDKIAFARFCVEQGVSVSEILDDEALRCAARYPVFARARRGKSGHQAFQIASPAELALRRAEHGELLVQELVTAPEVSLDGLADRDGRVLSVVPRLRGLVLGGESFVSRTVDSPRMVELGRHLAELLGLRGPFVAQAFDRGDRVDLIEVNPRFGGASALAIEAGADSPRALVRIAAGHDAQPDLGRYRIGLTMLRYTQDLFVDDACLEVIGGPRGSV
jgi:carbamoyl-phosphate synthase large subunit